MSKICTKCITNKPLHEFPLDKWKKDGHHSVCKECKRHYMKEYDADPKNLERKTEYMKNYYLENREAKVAYAHNRYTKDKTKHIKGMNAYFKRRRKTDPNFASQCTMRSIVGRMIRLGTGQKSKRAEYYVGCSPEDLRVHLESQFQDGMSWENRSKWHVDHIIPMSAFDLTSEQHLVLCSNWANLRPLWKKDNLSKWNKYPDLPIPDSVNSSDTQDIQFAQIS